MRKTKDAIKVKGFYRLQIVEGGKIVGDSGYKQNLVTNDGFNNFLCKLLGALSGSSQVGYVAIGTGGAPAATDTTLAGEIMSSTKKTAVTAASSSNSKTVRFTATYSSSNSFTTATYNISNMGLFASTQSTATLFAGNTYSSSKLDTNQDLNITYDIGFA